MYLVPEKVQTDSVINVKTVELLANNLNLPFVRIKDTAKQLAISCIMGPSRNCNITIIQSL